VGSVNTAQVGLIDVAMDSINNSGNDEIGQAIKELTEAVINNRELDKNEQGQILEQLAFIAKQAALPEDQRQISIVRTVLNVLQSGLEVATNLTALWTKWGSVLHKFF
jgi:predicted unusual protein kinase regulating ubiquinone biosynthesis (AarF/ABC1/UbiB family)